MVTQYNDFWGQKLTLWARDTLVMTVFSYATRKINLYLVSQNIIFCNIGVMPREGKYYGLYTLPLPLAINGNGEQYFTQD